VSAPVPGRVLLAALWFALMLVYLLGDVLRIFAGDTVPGEMAGQPASPWMWTVAALVMLIPIGMGLISLVLPGAVLRPVTVVVAGSLVLFNLAGLPYKGVYDNLLIGVSFALNAITAWAALAMAE
jgi:hypothetical protein